MPEHEDITHDFNGEGEFDALGGGFVLGTAPREDGKLQHNRGTIQTPKNPPFGQEGSGEEEILKEHLAALFANLNLSEDFVERAKTVFVAAVNEKSHEIGTQLSEHYHAEYTTALQTTVSELTEKVDDYLTYVVEEWVDQNKLQVERGIKIELAENFIFGLKKLFESNFVDVPDEKYDVLDELYNKIEEGNDNLNAAINENVKLRKNLLESHAINVFAQETHGLAATQAEKLASLAEGLEYESPEQFRNKLQILKESYFAAPQSPAIQAPSFRQQPRVLDILDTSSEPETLTEGVMNVYSKALSRHLKK